MGNIEIDYDSLKIYCFERPEDSKGWWECDITEEETTLLKENKVSAFEMLNDGREVY